MLNGLGFTPSYGEVRNVVVDGYRIYEQIGNINDYSSFSKLVEDI